MSADTGKISLRETRGALRILDENFSAFSFIAAYYLAVTLLAVVLKRPENIPGSIYIREWMAVPLLWLAGFMVLSALSVFRERGTVTDYLEKLRYLADPSLLAGMAIFMALGYFHGAFTSMKTLLPQLSPFAWDPFFADLDAAIHGGDAWGLLPLHPGFTRFVQFLYLPVWITALAAVSFYFCTFANRQDRTRYLKTFFFCWVFLGNIMAFAFMSAGPIFFERLTGDPRFSELTHYLEFTRSMPFSSQDVADFLWTSYIQDEMSRGSGISAFPSLHLAMATLWTAAFWKIRPWLAYAFAGYTVLIQIGSVHLGWHYAVDGYASIALTLAAWRLSGRQEPWPWERPRNREPDQP